MEILIKANLNHNLLMKSNQQLNKLEQKLLSKKRFNQIILLSLIFKLFFQIIGMQ